MLRKYFCLLHSLVFHERVDEGLVGLLFLNIFRVISMI